MKKYIITYDLHPNGQNYKGLIDAIEQYESIKGMLSVYFIKSSYNAKDIYNYLSQFIDDNDKIFISEINNNNNGFLSKDIWKFLDY